MYRSASFSSCKLRVHEILLACPVSQCARSRVVLVEKTAAPVTGATQRGGECEKSLALARVELQTFTRIFVIPVWDDLVKTGIYRCREVVLSTGRYSASKR